jgi:hypothetical protein
MKNPYAAVCGATTQGERIGRVQSSGFADLSRVEANGIP